MPKNSRRYRAILAAQGAPEQPSLSVEDVFRKDPALWVQTVERLQKETDDLLNPKKSADIEDRRARARKALALIEDEARKGFSDNRLRNNRGLALLADGRRMEAAACFEGLLQDPRHKKDSFTHGGYCRVNLAAGRPGLVIGHLDPLIRQGGILNGDPHIYALYARAMNDLRGPREAIGFLNEFAPPGSYMAKSTQVYATRTECLARIAATGDSPMLPVAGQRGAMQPEPAPGG